MRRIVVIVPDLVGEPSLLRDKLPTLAQMAELGRVEKLAPMPPLETPEALYLGMSPVEGQLRQGPLTISALGADPPDRSTHFHVSVLSFDGARASLPRVQISPDEERQILELAKKLDTKALTFVAGEQLDHGLVWEGLGDLGTTAPADFGEKTVKQLLPEGDADIILRRFIDDSVNLLAETEMNQRRVDEELPPLNMLWPWGHGVRTPVPNLAIRRGEPATVTSTSVRLQGLTRLAGYRHTARFQYGKALALEMEKLATDALGRDVTLILIDTFGDLRREGKLEEAAWLIDNLDRRLFKTLFEKALVDSTRLTVLAPGRDLGLAVAFQTKDANSNSIPFDERALEEKLLRTFDLSTAVATALSA